MRLLPHTLMPKLSIIADIKAKPDQVELVLSELEKLIPPTLQEEGCLNYDLHQDNEDPAHFLFYENWESRELWQQHMSSQHLKNFQSSTENALADLVITEMTHLK